jgi:hypothetical protein
MSTYQVGCDPCHCSTSIWWDWCAYHVLCTRVGGCFQAHLPDFFVLKSFQPTCQPTELRRRRTRNISGGAVPHCFASRVAALHILVQIFRSLWHLVAMLSLSLSARSVEKSRLVLLHLVGHQPIERCCSSLLQPDGPSRCPEPPYLHPTTCFKLLVVWCHLVLVFVGVVGGSRLHWLFYPHTLAPDALLLVSLTISVDRGGKWHWWFCIVVVVRVPYTWHERKRRGTRNRTYAWSLRLQLASFAHLYPLIALPSHRQDDMEAKPLHSYPKGEAGTCSTTAAHTPPQQLFCSRNPPTHGDIMARTQLHLNVIRSLPPRPPSNFLSPPPRARLPSGTI